jgi:hypothetical protein
MNFTVAKRLGQPLFDFPRAGLYLVSGIVMTTDDDDDVVVVAVDDEEKLIANTNNKRVVRYAMAVERLRNKRDVKNAFRGVHIP